jgi:phenylacetate-CoA ligase
MTLQELGFQTKEQLRARRYELQATDEVLYWFSSSGSTGDPVIYPWTAADQQVADRTVARAHARLPAMHGSTGFVIAPTGLPGMWYHMDRQLHHLGLATVLTGIAPERILSLLATLRPTLLMSLPLVLSRLGEAHAARGGPPLRDGVLFAGGDVLSAARRRRIETMWGAPLRNFYGLSEVFGPLATHSDASDALEWTADEVEIEILDRQTLRPVARGETGIAVLTTMWDRPASLKRYWTGDCFRLLRWSSPGHPVFEMRGREHVRLPGLLPEWFPVDLDDVLLSDPAAGNEWNFSERPEDVLLTVEANAPLDAIDRSTVARVEAMFDRGVELQAAAPGTLDRSVPKLAVASVRV